MKYYILLDVGGTQIKLFVYNELGEAQTEFPRKYQAKSNESKENIIINFSNIIDDNINSKLELIGIGMAFPGPFDYQKGQSLMKGISKYDSIYKISLSDAIKNENGNINNVPFIFLHDVASFALGICSTNKYKKYNRIMNLCIGTGTGTSFTENGCIVVNSNLIPENGWIYNTPFRDSIIDDYISVRGFNNLCKKHLGYEVEGYNLHKMAKEGNDKAITVFKEFGLILKDAIAHFLIDFDVQLLIFGGQISKSLCFFEEPLKSFCDNNNIAIGFEYNTSKTICDGLYSKFIEEQKWN